MKKYPDPRNPRVIRETARKCRQRHNENKRLGKPIRVIHDLKGRELLMSFNPFNMNDTEQELDK